MFEHYRASAQAKQWVARLNTPAERPPVVEDAIGLILLEAIVRYRGGDEVGALDCLGRFADEPLDKLSVALSPKFAEAEAAVARGLRTNLSDRRSLHCHRTRNSRAGSAELMPSLGLTPAQKKILRQVAWGASNEQIARSMGVSINTVKWHLKQIFSRLGTPNRCAAVTMARAQGTL